jgi:H+/Cl- antiporter ClcA
MSQLSRSGVLLGLFGIGVLLGIWELISPWVVGYGNSGLKAAAGSSVWSGAAVLIASLIALLLVSTAAIRRDMQSVASDLHHHDDEAVPTEPRADLEH